MCDHTVKLQRRKCHWHQPFVHPEWGGHVRFKGRYSVLVDDEDEDGSGDFGRGDRRGRLHPVGSDRYGARGAATDLFKSTSQRVGGRSVSGLSKESDLQTVELGDSLSTVTGRPPGLKFRKAPRQFLKGKSPPSSPISAKSISTIKSAAPPNAATVSSLSGNNVLTSSVSAASATPMSPSLRSKESTYVCRRPEPIVRPVQSRNYRTYLTPEAPKHGSHHNDHIEEPEKLRRRN
ncbi:hypothetical protein HD554DRAFT_2250210 [Boletus coccyginus]|nr:hypothetical protein HD554DRAFT_2250210 [Boletus coccyginus]